METDKLKLGEQIKIKRIEKGIKQKDLAKMLDMPISTLANYETDRRPIGIETLRKIAEVLDIPISDLVEESPFSKIRHEIRIKKLLLGEIYKDLHEKNELLDILGGELIENNDEHLEAFNKAESEYHSLLSLVDTIERELDELTNDLKNAESKASTYKEFGDIFSDEKERIEGKQLLEELEAIKQEELQKTLLTKFDKLNPTGKHEAIKRVDELSQISTYTRDETITINYDESE